MSKRDRSTSALRPAQSGHTNFARKIAARTTTLWFDWRHLRCKASLTPHWGGDNWTLLQLEIIAARDVPCPITTTGYLAHRIDAEQLAEAGGIVAFFTAWMEREASTKRYQKAEQLWRQGDLVDLLQLTDEEREP